MGVQQLNRRLVLRAIAERLDEQVSWATVSLGERTSDPPTIVVHAIDGGADAALLQRPGRAGDVALQLTCVAGPDEQAGIDQVEELAWTAVDALRGWRDDDAGIVRVHQETRGDARRDYEERPAVWFATPTLTVTVDQSRQEQP